MFLLFCQWRNVFRVLFKCGIYFWADFLWYWYTYHFIVTVSGGKYSFCICNYCMKSTVWLFHVPVCMCVCMCVCVCNHLCICVCVCMSVCSCDFGPFCTAWETLLAMGRKLVPWWSTWGFGPFEYYMDLCSQSYMPSRLAVLRGKNL